MAAGTRAAVASAARRRLCPVLLLPSFTGGLRPADPLARLRCSQLLFQQLLAIHPSVKATTRHKLFVRAALDDAAAVQDEDAIRIPDRGDAVRHNHRCA